MIKYLQLPFYFDVQQMQEELMQLQDKQWPLHYQTRHFEGEWSALALRSIDGTAANPIISPLEDAAYHDTELLQRSPYYQEVLKKFECPLLSVRLLKLSTGSVIKEHTDAELCFESGLARFHIPISTNDAVEFFLQGESIHLKEGECWYCNFNMPHSLANKGDTDRIHLVIDATVNEWIKELFSSDAVINKKEIDDPAPPGMDEHTKRETIRHLRMMNTATSNQLADEMENSLHRTNK
ncbi:MAG TPA: aspartyl/asparaginyl beta-hydroxylase domain-containing protein [Chitinophagaceae bacterium]|nr:aspartyl/asparaginyl beta-hydroxylase domain-containing protein [Chitinophagaceae bacterium]